MVRLIFEEHVDEVWRRFQLVCRGILLYLLGYLFDVLPVFLIVGSLYYHRLSRYAPLRSQSEQLCRHLLVCVDVEHNGVIVRLIGEEYGERCQYGCRDALSEPYRPHAAARHSVSGIVEDIIYDEYEHRDDYRHSESALSDDCSQRGTDEEEYDARKGEREFVYRLYLVLAQQLVAVARHHCLELQFVHVVLHRRHGVVHSPQLVVSR